MDCCFTLDPESGQQASGNTSLPPSILAQFPYQLSLR
jgi:hypothetical protein